MRLPLVLHNRPLLRAERTIWQLSQTHVTSCDEACLGLSSVRMPEGGLQLHEENANRAREALLLALPDL